MKKPVIVITVALFVAGAVGACSAPAETPAAEVVITETDHETVVEEATPETPAAVAGTTRENPAPLGTPVADGDWTVVINSVNLDANTDVAAANMFNEPPAENNVFIVVNSTVTYNGDDPQGESWMGQIRYITADGRTINHFDNFAVAPEPSKDTWATLFNGGSETGNLVFEVPAATAGQGTLSVSPSMFSDATFVAVS